MHHQDTIPAGGVLRLPNISGSLFLLTDSGTATEVDVALTMRGRSPVRAPRIKRGFRAYLRDRSFDGIEITGPAGAIIQFFVESIDIQVSVVDGAEVSIPSGVVVTNPIGSPVPVNAIGAVLTATDVGVLSPTTLADIADVSVLAGATTQVVAAAAGGVVEREIVLKNLMANAAAFRVGAATAGAARGIELLPGEAIVLNTRAAVYAYNAGAAPQSLSLVTNSR